MNITDNYVEFFALADWGGQFFYPFTTSIQRNIADFINEYSYKNNVHFNLGIGDNFYQIGVQDVNDTRFKDTFEDVYVYNNTPWYFVLGNHDYYGNPQAQIDYTEISKRWILPDYFYNVHVNINQGKTKFIYFLMIDTILLCYRKSIKDEFGNEYMIKQKDESIDYFEKLENDLKNSKDYPYVIIVSHYPIWSVSKHGPTHCLVEKLRPLLHKYNVNAFFAGHDHDMQHFADTLKNSTIDYIITGATNTPSYDMSNIYNVPNDTLKFYWSDKNQTEGAFTLVKADLISMNISFLKMNGDEIYKINIKNKAFKPSSKSNFIGSSRLFTLICLFLIFFLEHN
ncbi:unnamed protein product [Brachionus calyciflorus]|uniref:Tartrate-resistant acid phosphatase type 5 n=1 Tax=Brachionus calyciflorus TaxID=104777 RepID=A0A813Z1X4_9BILA|nr:unnamed protein product [Brachionus calyciflorus]